MLYFHCLKHNHIRTILHFLLICCYQSSYSHHHLLYWWTKYRHDYNPLKYYCLETVMLVGFDQALVGVEEGEDQNYYHFLLVRLYFAFLLVLSEGYSYKLWCKNKFFNFAFLRILEKIYRNYTYPWFYIIQTFLHRYDPHWMND